MEIKKYPDGSSYAQISVNKLQELEFRINSYEDLWHLHQCVDAFNHSILVPPIITIPNLIDAQADRRFKAYQSFGLKLVCEFLNNMKAKFRIFHPHNPEVVQALINDVHIIDNSYFITKVIELLGWKNKAENQQRKDQKSILMSSDAGGFKPLIKLCETIGWSGETYSASKARNPKTGELTQLIDRQDFQGKDILIVDDICVYGGTFKGLAKLLKERNCGKLYLAVSHITVQNLGNDPVTNYFDTVFTTNSKYNEYYFQAFNNPHLITENLQIIKLFNI